MVVHGGDGDVVDVRHGGFARRQYGPVSTGVQVVRQCSGLSLVMHVFGGCHSNQQQSVHCHPMKIKSKKDCTRQRAQGRKRLVSSFSHWKSA